VATAGGPESGNADLQIVDQQFDLFEWDGVEIRSAGEHHPGEAHSRDWDGFEVYAPRQYPVAGACGPESGNIHLQAIDQHNESLFIDDAGSCEHSGRDAPGRSRAINRRLAVVERPGCRDQDAGNNDNT
jgi:hypothetical protein